MRRSYFEYLKEKVSYEVLIERLGVQLDRFMTTDVNLTGRSAHLYDLAREGAEGPLSTSFASALLDRCGAGDRVLIVTGCPVRPAIDPTVGEPDGPAGAAALARALYMVRGCIAVVVAPDVLLPQVEAAFRTAGAVPLAPEALSRVGNAEAPLFAASLVGLPLDQDLSEAAEALLREHRPKAVISVEHLGMAADGKAYLSTGKAVAEGVLYSDPIFRQAGVDSVLRGSCVDNPNEAGTARLFSSAARHPAVAEDFEHVVPGAAANWSAYAVAAAVAALGELPEAAFTEELDEACVTAALRAGSIDPFSGFADPIYGVDTVEPPYYGWVTSLMARAARGFCDASRFAR